MSFWTKIFAGPRFISGVSFPTAPASDVAAAIPKRAEPYAMKRTGDNSAEIELYGDIVSSKPTDWFGEPIEGQYIILSEFLEDLKQVEDVAHLTVRIHSAGGSAYDAMTIHNRLQALAADITVIVDGVAMSGGSLIMCAGDTVQVYPGSLVMIHKCWSFLFGGYNAAELRKIADSDDAVDRSQAAIYQSKTGLPTEELLTMMEAETYMTGQEAVDKGFADTLVDGSALEVAASADRRTLYAGGRPVWATSRKDGIPAAIPTVNPEASATVSTNKHKPAQTGRQNGGKTMAKNLEELRKENQSLAEQLMAEARAAVSMSAATTTNAPAAAVSAGTPATTPADSAAPAPQAPEGQPPSAQADPVQAERQRIQEIDALASLYDAETIQTAKYGPDACTAAEMAYRAAQKAAQQGTNYVGALERDTQASGAQSIPAATSGGNVPGAEGDLTPQQLMAKGRADAKTLTNPEKEEK